MFDPFVREMVESATVDNSGLPDPINKPCRAVPLEAANPFMDGLTQTPKDRGHDKTVATTWG